MKTSQLHVERVSYISHKSIREVLKVFDSELGHPKMEELWASLGNARSVAEVDDIMQSKVGPSGLIEFLRFNHGQIIHKGKSGTVPGNIRLVVGNPSVMRRMAERVADAGSYAPVTILVDERSDGTHLSYDRMASFLESYGNEAALKVAKDLDAKVERLMSLAAS
jgi:hypothetical protein